VILQKLRLTNFRQYRGEHELVFSSDRDRNVTVIAGENGEGKTALFYALNWVLYGGAEAIPDRLISKGASTADPTSKCTVELQFIDEGRIFVARREMVPTSSAGEREGAFTLEEHDSGGRVRPIADPSLRMNAILPEDARRYFFFDAERIDDLARAGHEQQVREAVRSVLKLKVLERAAHHLDDVRRESAKALSKADLLSAQEKAMLERTEDLEARIAAGTEKARLLREGVSEVEEQLRIARTKLEHLSEIKAIQAQERAVRERIERFESDRARIDSELRDMVSRAAPALAVTAINRAGEILAEKRAAGEIPAGIRQTVIDDILGTGTCICGRTLDGPAHEVLTARRTSSASNELVDALFAASTGIAALRQDRSMGTRMREAVQHRDDLKTDLTEAQRELDEIHSKLLTDYSEDVTKLEQTREALERRYRDLQVEAGIEETETEKAKLELTKIRAGLDTVAAKNDEVRRSTRRYQLAGESAEAARNVLALFTSDMRQRIGVRADEQFKRMVWKRETFIGVSISEDYKLEVTDRFGPGSQAGLSAGERQILGLAFITGMSKVTGEEAPLVIDTPFGRISDTPVTNLVRELPSIAKQLVLLVTPREIGEEDRKLLQPRIGREYRLRFDDRESATTIERVA
jgi:DNA sulfur modification protein DndD